jgi:hypothetical protein
MEGGGEEFDSSDANYRWNMKGWCWVREATGSSTGTNCLLKIVNARACSNASNAVGLRAKEGNVEAVRDESLLQSTRSKYRFYYFLSLCWLRAFFRGKTFAERVREMCGIPWQETSTEKENYISHSDMFCVIGRLLVGCIDPSNSNANLLSNCRIKSSSEWYQLLLKCMGLIK